MIYFDNASTTKISKLGLEVYNDLSNNCYYNCSSLHKGGILASNELASARKTFLKCINGELDDTLIFCSGATEANNMALNGLTKSKARALTSWGEHPSVFNITKYAKNDLTIDLVPLNKDGEVDIEAFTNLVNTNNYDLVSIMLVNNETGAINDISRLSEIVKATNPKCIFHSDCVQAFGKIEVAVDILNIDAASFSAHKINGPKGVGALYLKKNLSYKPLIFGGGQENGNRSGTENLPAIVSFAKVAEDKCKNLQLNYVNAMNIKNKILDIFDKNKFQYKINGGPNGSPYILSISFEGVRGEVLLRKLEIDNIIVGTGSACSSKSENNRILSSMGDSKEEIFGNIRLSFGCENTIEEAEYVALSIIQNVENLRSL